jgi:HD-GYP domain-containing protein (c-di-GMP phosphodiesterase class II)
LLAGGLGFDAPFRRALVQNGERWDGTGGPDKVRGEAIALSARIAQAAYECELGHRFGGADGIRERLLRLRARCLDPAIVDRLLEAVDELALVAAVPSAWQAMLDAEPRPQRELDGEALEEALSTISMFADLKSAYTRGHSAAVAELAAAATRAEGLPADVVEAVRHAGLLHDLGRVAVSGGIWDKERPLTDMEREKIRLHSYIGERLLSRAPTLARIAEITSLTHERLDGSGYHRRVTAAAVPPEARILAAADVYQALVEDRPHRKAFSAEAAAAELTAMAETGALCPDATRAVLSAAGHAPPKLDRVDGLTSRQVEVLRLLARGLTNKEIANALDISAKTAGHHVQHIFGKLGVTTRSGAAIHAMRYGISG